MMVLFTTKHLHKYCTFCDLLLNTIILMRFHHLLCQNVKFSDSVYPLHHALSFVDMLKLIMHSNQNH